MNVAPILKHRVLRSGYVLIAFTLRDGHYFFSTVSPTFPFQFGFHTKQLVLYCSYCYETTDSHPA